MKEMKVLIEKGIKEKNSELIVRFNTSVEPLEIKGKKNFYYS